MSDWIEEKNIWGGIDRYRIGARGEKEYEQQIYLAGGHIVPESKLEAYNERKRQGIEDQRKQAEMQQKEAEKERFCVFRLSRQTTGAKCLKDECAFFCESGCAFSLDQPVQVKKPDGKFCAYIGQTCIGKCNMNTGEECRLPKI